MSKKLTLDILYKLREHYATTLIYEEIDRENLIEVEKCIKWLKKK